MWINFAVAVAACWNIGGAIAALLVLIYRPAPVTGSDAVRAYQASPEALRTLLELEERERVVALLEQRARAERDEQAHTRELQVAWEQRLQEREGELRALSLDVLAELAQLEEARRPVAIELPMDYATPMLPAGEPVCPAWLSDMSIYDAIGRFSAEQVVDDVPAEDEPEPAGPETTTGEDPEWTPDPVAYAELVNAQQPKRCTCATDAAACGHCVDGLGRQVHDFAALGEPEPSGGEVISATPTTVTTHAHDGEKWTVTTAPAEPVAAPAEAMAFESLSELVDAAATGAVAVELVMEARERVTHKLNKRKLTKVGGGRHA